MMHFYKTVGALLFLSITLRCGAEEAKPSYSIGGENCEIIVAAETKTVDGGRMVVPHERRTFVGKDNYVLFEDVIDLTPAPPLSAWPVKSAPAGDRIFDVRRVGCSVYVLRNSLDKLFIDRFVFDCGDVLDRDCLFALQYSVGGIPDGGKLGPGSFAIPKLSSGKITQASVDELGIEVQTDDAHTFQKMLRIPDEQRSPSEAEVSERFLRRITESNGCKYVEEFEAYDTIASDSDPIVKAFRIKIMDEKGRVVFREATYNRKVEPKSGKTLSEWIEQVRNNHPVLAVGRHGHASYVAVAVKGGRLVVERYVDGQAKCDYPFLLNCGRGEIAELANRREILKPAGAFASRKDVAEVVSGKFTEVSETHLAIEVITEKDKLERRLVIPEGTWPLPE